mmetsp:Transcript_4444/g.15604  ORF Transcript_4444/g.15604 Transcript_4444/m.15604 type:complete len:205 (+) Transcript_4444:1069-1683(+)
MMGVDTSLFALMISLIRGTPCVMFMEATPAKWKVLRVIWVVGSPTLWEQMAPTGVPGSTRARWYFWAQRPRNSSTRAAVTQRTASAEWWKISCRCAGEGRESCAGHESASTTYSRPECSSSSCAATSSRNASTVAMNCPPLSRARGSSSAAKPPLSRRCARSSAAVKPRAGGVGRGPSVRRNSRGRSSTPWVPSVWVGSIESSP